MVRPQSVGIHVNLSRIALQEILKEISSRFFSKSRKGNHNNENLIKFSMRYPYIKILFFCNIENLLKISNANLNKISSRIFLKFLWDFHFENLELFSMRYHIYKNIIFGKKQKNDILLGESLEIGVSIFSWDSGWDFFENWLRSQQENFRRSLHGHAV